MLAIEIKQLSNLRSGKTVLSNINLKLEIGKILGIIGINGAGKTTLIKTILNLTKQDSGHINILEQSSLNAKSRKQVCYLPEKFIPPHLLTGQEFIDLSLSQFDLKPDVEEIRMSCASMELEYNMLKQKIDKYSKGMSQKLGLITTFLTNRQLYILDEPMSGLDPLARILLKRKMKNVMLDKSKSIMFSSHILSDIQELCDEIAILNAQNITFSGTPTELLNIHSCDNIEDAFLMHIQAQK